MAGGGVKYDAQQRRIRCHGHILNIAAQAFFLEDKKAINAAFKKARKKLKAELKLKDNQIKELLAKRFKKGKASKFTYRLISPPGKVHNVITYI